MRREGIVLQPQAIGGEDRGCAGRQTLPDLVHKAHGIVVGPLADTDHRHDFGLCIQRHSYENMLLQAAQLGDQFIQLELRADQIVEEVVVQTLGMGCRACQPAVDGALIVLEDPAGRRDIDALAGRGHHLVHSAHRGFQVVHRGCHAHTEFRMARLTAQVLDGVRAVVPAIADQRMHPRVGDLEVRTPRIGTPLTISLNDFRSPPLALLPGP
jgi:hypothetical protein